VLTAHPHEANLPRIEFPAANATFFCFLRPSLRSTSIDSAPRLVILRRTLHPLDPWPAQRMRKGEILHHPKTSEMH
jgi:hypothetical protein